MDRQLLLIGTFNNIPLAIDVETGQLLEQVSDGMGNIFQDIGGFFSNAADKVQSTGVFQTVSKAFDPNTQVGAVVTTNIQNHLNNLINGGSGVFQGGGFNPTAGFNPALQPALISGQVAPRQDTNNTPLFIAGGLVLITLVFLAIRFL